MGVCVGVWAPLHSVPYFEFLKRQINQYCLPRQAHCRSLCWRCGCRCEMLLLAHCCMHQLDSFLHHPLHPRMHWSQITEKKKERKRKIPGCANDSKDQIEICTHCNNPPLRFRFLFCVRVCSASQWSHLFCKNTLSWVMWQKAVLPVFVLQCIRSDWFFRESQPADW